MAISTQAVTHDSSSGSFVRYFESTHAQTFGEVRADLSRVWQNWTMVPLKLDHGIEFKTKDGRISSISV